MSPDSDTIAAIATPVGEGGLGVIRISGTSAVTIAKQIFQPLKSIDLSSTPSHTCHVGVIVKHHPSPNLSLEGRGNFIQPPLLSRERAGVRDGPIDQAVATLFRAPHSYTGEDIVEISAHGSPFVLREILNLCVQHGARLARPGEFTERAFLSGKIDLTQAEAVADLIRAKTDQAHAAAMGQLNGRLAQRVRECRDVLLPLLAHVEVGLDHADEDHAFLNRPDLLEKCSRVQKNIEELLASAKVSKILREGLRLAIVGRPNVGKSSLLNALLKEDRAIVTPIPGTTRDTLEEQVDWEGIPVVLTDTAGLRKNAQDPVEQLGIARSHEALQNSDVALCIFDASEPLTAEDRSLIALCAQKPHLWVVNKTDLTATWTELDLLRSSHRIPSPLEGEGEDGGTVSVLAPPPPSSPSRGEEFIRVSAKTGTGLESLVRAVKEIALGGAAVNGGAQWMINARHRQALERAREALIEATAAAQKEAFEECVALELHQALEALGEIIGETTTEDMLDQIFSTFCIGK